MKDIEQLKQRLRIFSDERHWDSYHTPKNLASALIVEAAELLEHFQWLTGAESQFLSEDKKLAVQEELADIFIYLVRLADQLGVDLIEAAGQKMAINEKRFPVPKTR